MIAILKSIMLYDETGECSIYGKTGTNKNKEGWYVGVAQKDKEDYYFAVYLDGGNTENPVSGQAAKDIVLEIFKSM